MSEQTHSRGTLLTRLAILALLVAGYVALAACFHYLLHTDAVYTHALYVPIVLACVWWGRRGALLVLPLVAVLLSMRAVGIGAAPLWTDLARAGFFAIVAVFVGTLSERVSAGRQAVLQSEDKYRRLIEESLAGIFVCADERILFVNARLGRMLGHDPQAMVGMSLWDLVLKDHQPEVRKLLQERAPHEPPDVQYECRLVRKDGSPLWVELASCRTVYEGRPAALANVYDITEHKEAERRRSELFELTRRQEEQLVHSTRLAELGEMAATIAHELNQPLTGIKNYAKNATYMMEQNAGSAEDVKENLRLIAGQVDRAARIIGQMRELTRRAEHIMAPVDVNDSVRETVDFLMPQFRLSNVEVSLELAEGLPPVLGDKVRLEQVFLNLLANARQALEECPERRLWVRTYLEAGSPWPVTIEVEDSGVGFAPEDRDKLFRPFYSTKKDGRGTGLGLSISLSIVRDHRGEIGAVGAVGKGAKFTVRLPAAAQSERMEAEHART